MTDTGTEVEKATAWDVEEMASGQVLDVLTKGSDDAFVQLADSLDLEEKSDAVAVLSVVSRNSTLRAGYLLYQMRQETPDGEWGRKVYEYAEHYGVSERTIHRWMKGAQTHFGLELTPAQKNAAASTPAEEDGSWLDDDGAIFELEGYNDPVSYEDSELRRMNDEAGWGDDTLPSADYENPPERPANTPRPPAVEPDSTWIDFTIASLQAEHDNSYSDEAARRMAVSRWQGKLEREPLELYSDLETIYGSRGEEVPDAVVAALLEAEEQRPIKPDAVEQPKKARGGGGSKLAYSQAEKILTATRQLHEHVYTGQKAGSIDDKEVAAMLPHLQAARRMFPGLIEMAEDAKKRYLAENGGSMQDKIAETQAKEAAADDDPDY